MFSGQEIASLYAKVGADLTDWNDGMSKVQKDLNVFEKGFGGVTNAVGAFAKSTVAAGGLLAGAIVAVGTNFNNMRQQAEVAFTTMLGSGEKARAFLDDLQDFAAKTPFEFPDLVRASQRLIAMGISAKDVKPTLTAIGDAVAGLGGSSEMIDRVTTAIGQMQAKGKVSAEEMMQLTEAGIPAWEMLAKKIGVSIPEAMKQVTAGAVASDVAIKGLVDGMNERFGGLMAKQSETFGGLISTLKDTATQAAGTVMQPAFQAMIAGLKRLVDFTSQSTFTAGIETFANIMRQWINAGRDFADRILPPLLQHLSGLWERAVKVGEVIQQVSTAIWEIAKPVMQSVRQFITWKDALNGVLLVIGGALLATLFSFVSAMAPVIAVVGAAIAAVALLRNAWQNDWNGVRTFTNKVLEDLTSWFYEKSGIWKGTWDKTLAYLRWWAEYGWRDAFYNPITNWLRETTGWLRSSFWGWVDYAKSILLYFGDEIRHRFSIVKQEATHIWDTFLDQTRRNAQIWYERVVHFFHQLYVGAVIWVRDLYNSVTDWFQRTFDWFKPREWWDSGVAIMKGFWDGIRTTWTDFWDWMQARWTQLRDGFRQFFGIHSPSKMFMEFGQSIGEGFNIGVSASMADTPQVLTEAVLGGTPTGSTTYNTSTANTFNLSYAGGGTNNAADLRNEVTRLAMLYAA